VPRGIVAPPTLPTLHLADWHFPTKIHAMMKIRSGVWLALLVAGCGSDAPPGASAALDREVTDSPLARVQNASLIRAGDGFILAGYDNGVVRWGRLALDGSLTQEASFTPAQPPVVGPVFAVTKKATPGDQLVALAFVGSATVSEGFDLTATVQTGTAVPASPVVLATLPGGTDPTTIQLAAGAAASGNVGWVAWGVHYVPGGTRGIPISYLTLPADAVTTATPSSFLGSPSAADAPDWDCLAAQGRSTGFSFGAVTPNPNFITSDFNTVEVAENGDTVMMTYQLTVEVADCEIVGAPTPAGSYFMGFQGVQNGALAIDFATYYPPIDPSQDGTVTTQHPVLPAAQFGGPIDMPKPAWASSAGGDIVIGLSRKSGPEVVRYTYNAVPHGSTLKLRSVNGNAGPVAAWVGDDAVYVTYADQLKSGIKRYFMRIDSPAALP
jgi:hypothetical protein